MINLIKNEFKKHETALQKTLALQGDMIKSTGAIFGISTSKNIIEAFKDAL